MYRDKSVESREIYRGKVSLCTGVSMEGNPRDPVGSRRVPTGDTRQSTGFREILRIGPMGDPWASTPKPGVACGRSTDDPWVSTIIL